MTVLYANTLFLQMAIANLNLFILDVIFLLCAVSQTSSQNNFFWEKIMDI